MVPPGLFFMVPKLQKLLWLLTVPPALFMIVPLLLMVPTSLLLTVPPALFMIVPLLLMVPKWLMVTPAAMVIVTPVLTVHASPDAIVWSVVIVVSEAKTMSAA